MPPVRVLMFGWELPPFNTGGLGVACYGLARSLSQLGVNISFALPRRLPVNIPFMNLLSHSLQGVQITALNALLKSYQTQAQYTSESALFNDFPGFYGPSIYDEAMRYATIAADWSRTQPHALIHAHDWMTYPAGIAAKKASGKPLIAHVHATEYDRTGGNLDSRIADVEYQGYQAADKIITVSNYTKNIVHDYYQVPQEKITVVHNGIDPVEFTARDVRRIFPHDQIVLYVGRLTFQKGVDHYLWAAKEVLKTHPNTVFLVVGDGDMYQKLVMESAYLGIANRVIFTGFMSGPSLKDIYQLADVFVMPSISEPYGLVALEAVASGVPVIISKQSGVSETLNHAYTVDFWDIQKMSRLIGHVLDYPALSRETAHLARNEINQHTWKDAARETLSLYQKMLN